MPRTATKTKSTKRTASKARPARAVTKTKRSVRKAASAGVKRRTRRFADGEKLIKSASGRVVSSAKSKLGKTSPNVVFFHLNKYAAQLLEDAGKLNPPLSSATNLKERMMLVSSKQPQGKRNAALISKTYKELKSANADLLAKIKTDKSYLKKVLASKMGMFTPVDV
jgi:hypothetical protein